MRFRLAAGEGAANESEESMGEGIEGLEEELDEMGNRVLKGERNGAEREKERDLVGRSLEEERKEGEMVKEEGIAIVGAWRNRGDQFGQ